MDLDRLLGDPEFEDLRKSYDLVGKKFESLGNLKSADFESSRSLFEDESLALGKPRPKRLEVLAVVAGLQFSEDLRRKIQEFQNEIREILDDSLAYWVLPQNLGLEFFVLKWPEQSLKKEQIFFGEEFLDKFQKSQFQVHFNGVQVHRDGCVIARGFDVGSIIRKCRNPLILNKRISSRQSNWSHVPLGRILEPFSATAYEKIKKLVNQSQTKIFHTELIECVSLIHETRWYMEENKLLGSKKLQPDKKDRLEVW